MVLAAYNGLPLSLAQVGAALKLEQQKMKAELVALPILRIKRLLPSESKLQNKVAGWA